MKKYCAVDFFVFAFLGFIFLLPNFAGAATATSTTAISKIKITVSIPVPIVATSTFQRSLTTGSVGNDVLTLQKYLNQRGYTIAKSGVGSIGNETTLFGSLTKSAIIKFQNDHRISPAAGYFGPLTRGIVLKLENDLRVARAGLSASGGGSGGGGGGAVAWQPYASNNNSSSNTSSTAISTTTASTTGQAQATTTPAPIPAIPPISAIARVLSYGSEGGDVLALQDFLNKQGYPVNRTSIYDAQTLEAVIQFQTNYGLPPSGYLGAFTLSVMNSVQNGTYVAGSSDADAQLNPPVPTVPILIQGN